MTEHARFLPAEFTRLPPGFARIDKRAPDPNLRHMKSSNCCKHACFVMAVVRSSVA
jgi:hypothetical protein